MTKILLSSNAKESIALLSIGTFLEYFDLLLFVHLAVILNELFFPKTDPFTASLYTAGAFCTTYIARLGGAWFFGWIGDNMGRKFSLTLTTLMMSISCLIISVLPTYAAIGIVATWAIVICRIIQGMASTGERIGAEIYLTEIIRPPLQYPIVASIAIFSTLGGTAALGASKFVFKYDLNWRILFILGAFIAIIGVIARSRLKESNDFEVSKKQHDKLLEEQLVNKDDRKKILNLPIYNYKTPFKMKLAFFALRCYYPIGFYFVYIFCANILKNKFNYTSVEIISQNFIISTLEVCRSIIIPILSYYIYPLKIMRFKVILFFLGIVICPYLLNVADSGTYIFWIQVYFVIIMLSSSPGLPIFYSYLPIMNRSLNGGWIYALSHAIMYAFSSFGITYFVKEFNYFGLFIVMIPIAVFYTFGLNYFIKLEKESGCYP